MKWDNMLKCRTCKYVKKYLKILIFFSIVITILNCIYIQKTEIYIAESKNWKYTITVYEKKDKQYELEYDIEYIGKEFYNKAELLVKTEFCHSSNLIEKKYIWDSKDKELPKVRHSYPANTFSDFVTPKSCSFSLNGQVEKIFFEKR